MGCATIEGLWGCVRTGPTAKIAAPGGAATSPRCEKQNGVVVAAIGCDYALHRALTPRGQDGTMKVVESEDKYPVGRDGWRDATCGWSWGGSTGVAPSFQSTAVSGFQSRREDVLICCLCSVAGNRVYGST